MLVSTDSPDPWLERIKAEIRDEAAAARQRTPLPRVDPPPRAQAASSSDGIERERLDYVISELTGLDHGAFVDNAYRALLKRNPDEGGAGFQLGLLMNGADKTEILGNLRWSAEGRHIGVRVRGLRLRYVLAKLSRLPLVGYPVAWLLALLKLPAMLRDQRLLQATLCERASLLAMAQATLQRQLEQLEATQRGLAAQAPHRDEQARQLAARVDAMERAGAELRTDLQAAARERADVSAAIEPLRHYVHTTHHWLTSLREGMVELEAAATREQQRADELVAALVAHEAAQESPALSHRDWAATLAQQLPAGALVMDLGSGEGTWPAALIGQGLTVAAVDANAVLVARAQARGIHVALGDPAAVLARCADASVIALSLSATLLSDAVTAARLFDEARRAMVDGAPLLLRVETGAAPAALVNDAPTAAAWLQAAGFGEPRTLAAHARVAVLVHKR